MNSIIYLNLFCPYLGDPHREDFLPYLEKSFVNQVSTVLHWWTKKLHRHWVEEDRKPKVTLLSTLFFCVSWQIDLYIGRNVWKGVHQKCQWWFSLDMRFQKILCFQPCTFFVVWIFFLQRGHRFFFFLGIYQKNEISKKLLKAFWPLLYFISENLAESPGLPLW